MGNVPARQHLGLDGAPVLGGGASGEHPAGLYEWLEDIGWILLDMMAAYYGLRPLVRTRRVPDGQGGEREEPVVELCDFTRFRDLWFKLRVDVGASSYFSEIAMTQTLDNLRQNGTLDVIQYLERVPDKLIPRKAELIQELRQAQQAMARTQNRRQGGPHRGRQPQRRQDPGPAARQHPGRLSKPPRRSPAGPGEKGADVTSPKHPPPIFL